MNRVRSGSAEAGYETCSRPRVINGTLSFLDKVYRLAESREFRRRIVAASLGVLALGFAARAESDSTAAAVPAVPLAMRHTEAGTIAPAKWTGVLEDAGKQPSEEAAIQKMSLVEDLLPDSDSRSAGIYIKESLWIAPGQVAPDPKDFQYLENSIRAAQAHGYNVCLAVWPFTWGKKKDHWQPPQTSSRQWQYTTLLATVNGMLAKDFNGENPVKCWFIGNEPNNPTFWWPQFKPDGTDKAPAAYEHLLARSYDTLKKISPENIVVGGELSSRGNDDPHSKRASLSPEVFIKGMGEAYRESGRTQPIMDVFGYHPYALNSSESPNTLHKDPSVVGVADYSRLVSSLKKAFDGTNQLGSTLPILYSEFGVESIIPPAQKYRYDKHPEPGSSGAVDEATQAKYYDQYFRLAACQPNVIGAFVFHTLDERSRKKGWQSGAFYSDGSPKSSMPDISQGMTSLSSGGMICDS